MKKYIKEEEGFNCDLINLNYNEIEIITFSTEEEEYFNVKEDDYRQYQNFDEFWEESENLGYFSRLDFKSDVDYEIFKYKISQFRNELFLKSEELKDDLI